MKEHGPRLSSAEVNLARTRDFFKVHGWLMHDMHAAIPASKPVADMTNGCQHTSPPN